MNEKLQQDISPQDLEVMLAGLNFQHNNDIYRDFAAKFDPRQSKLPKIYTEDLESYDYKFPKNGVGVKTLEVEQLSNLPITDILNRIENSQLDRARGRYYGALVLYSDPLNPDNLRPVLIDDKDTYNYDQESKFQPLQIKADVLLKKIAQELGTPKTIILLVHETPTISEFFNATLLQGVPNSDKSQETTVCLGSINRGEGNTTGIVCYPQLSIDFIVKLRSLETKFKQEFRSRLQEFVKHVKRQESIRIHGNEDVRRFLPKASKLFQDFVTRFVKQFTNDPAIANSLARNLVQSFSDLPNNSVKLYFRRFLPQLPIKASQALTSWISANASLPQTRLLVADSVETTLPDVTTNSNKANLLSSGLTSPDLAKLSEVKEALDFTDAFLVYSETKQLALLDGSDLAVAVRDELSVRKTILAAGSQTPKLKDIINIWSITKTNEESRRDSAGICQITHETGSLFRYEAWTINSELDSQNIESALFRLLQLQNQITHNIAQIPFTTLQRTSVLEVALARKEIVNGVVEHFSQPDFESILAYESQFEALASCTDLNVDPADISTLCRLEDSVIDEFLVALAKQGNLLVKTDFASEDGQISEYLPGESAAFTALKRGASDLSPEIVAFYENNSELSVLESFMSPFVSALKSGYSLSEVVSEELNEFLSNNTQGILEACSAEHNQFGAVDGETLALRLLPVTIRRRAGLDTSTSAVNEETNVKLALDFLRSESMKALAEVKSKLGTIPFPAELITNDINELLSDPIFDSDEKVLQSLDAVARALIDTMSNLKNGLQRAEVPLRKLKDAPRSAFKKVSKSWSVSLSQEEFQEIYPLVNSTLIECQTHLKNMKRVGPMEVLRNLELTAFIESKPELLEPIFEGGAISRKALERQMEVPDILKLSTLSEQHEVMDLEPLLLGFIELKDSGSTLTADDLIWTLETLDPGEGVIGFAPVTLEKSGPLVSVDDGLIQFNITRKKELNREGLRAFLASQS